MLGKKVLNFIGTFLLGSQLISFANAVPVTIELKACSEYEGFDSDSCDNASAATAYCIEGNKVYGVNGNAENACKLNSGFELTKNTLNIVNPSQKQKFDFSDEPNIANALAALADPGKFVLVDCDNGTPAVCKQTQGYIKDASDNVYSFAGTKVGVPAGDLIVDGLVEGGCKTATEGRNIGKILTAKTGICIEKEKSVPITAASNANYHVLSGALATGTPFEDENTVVLKITDNYIIKDKLNPVPESMSIEKCPSNPDTCANANSYPHGYFCIWETKMYSFDSTTNSCRPGTALSLNGGLNLVRIDGSIGYAVTDLDDKIDGLANPDGYVLVDCVSGTCKQASGYLVNDSSVYKFIDTNVGASASDVVDENLTSKGGCSGKVGKVFRNGGSICVNSAESIYIPDTVPDPIPNYIIAKGEGVAGTPFENSDYDVVLKTGKKYVIKDSHFTDVCVANVQDNKVTGSSKFNTMNSTANYKLFDCQNGNCRQTQGYTLTGSNIYAFVGTAVGETTSGKAAFLGNPAIAESTDTAAQSACTAAYNGKIYIYNVNSAGICIVYKDHTGTEKNIGINIEEAGPGGNNEYLILKGTAVAGTPFENKSENIAVKRTGKYIVRDQFISTVNLFDKANHSIVDTAAGFNAVNEYLNEDDGTQKNYYIYDCKDGICRQTSGYIISNNNNSHTDDVIAFVGEGSGAHAAAAKAQADSADCIATEVGIVLHGKDGICYAAEKTILFASGESRYIMLKGKAVDGTPFADNVNSVVIKRGAAYIVRDKFYTSLNMVDADGTIETDFTETITLSTYVIVDCKEGVCKQSNGFVNNNNVMYAFVRDSQGTVVSNQNNFIGGATLTDETKCEEANAGLLYSDTKGICINKEKGIAFADDDNEYMILRGKEINSNNPFAEGVKKNIKIKRSANYILNDNFYTSVTLVNKVDGTLTTDFATDNEGLAATPSNYAVVDCNDGDCIQTQGYVVNNGKAFAFIEEEFGVEAKETLLASSCSADKVGKLLSNFGGVCVGSGSSSMAFNADGAEYIVMKGSAVQGTPYEEVDDILPVKRTSNYIIRDYFYSNTNMVNKVDGSVSTDFSRTVPGLATAPSNFVMVECLDGSCKQTQGYVKNNNAVYAFVGENGGKKTESVEEFVGASVIEADSCGSTNGGKLIKDNEGICYPTTGKSIKFENSDDIYIMMKGGAATGNPFEDKDNGIPIKQNANYILKDVFYTEVNLFDPTTGKVKTDLRNAVDSDIGKYTKLVDCVDGICKQTSGYVVGVSEIYNFNGESNGLKDSSHNGENCNTNAVGKYKNGRTGVCIKDGDNPVNFSDKTKNIKHIMETAAQDGTAFENAGTFALLKHGADYFIIDKFDSVNLYKQDSEEVFSDFDSQDLSTISTYNVIDCVNGICKLTSGYVKNKYGVYKFISDATSVSATDIVAAGVTQASGCIKDHVGKHFTDAKGHTEVCITVGHTVNMERPSNHMFMEDTVITGTPFVQTGSGVPVKSGKGYVVQDKFNTKVNIVKVEDGSSTNDHETAHVGLISNPSDYIIVDCIGVKCAQTSGYVVNDGKVYSFVGTEGGREVTSSTVVSSLGTTSECGDQHVGKFIKTKDAMCYSSGKGITLNEATNEIVFKEVMPEGSPFEDSTSAIKHGKNYIVKDKFNHINGVYAFNVEDGKIAELSTLTDGTVGNYKIVQCVNQECVQTNGYIEVTVHLTRRDYDESSLAKRDDTVIKYYEFIGNEVGRQATKPGTAIAVGGCDGTEGATKNVGQIFENTAQGVCIDTGKGIAFGNNDSYIILKGLIPAGTPFSDNNYNVPVKRDTVADVRYIIVDKFISDGVKLVKKADGTFITELNTVSLNTYFLVDCLDGICKQTEGYVLDDTSSGRVIGFVGEGVGALGVAATSDTDTYLGTPPINEISKCEEEYIGKIYNTKYGVCAYQNDDTKIGVPFVIDPPEEARYIINEGVTGTPFAGSNIVIRRGNRFIIKDLFYNSGDYCIYPNIGTREIKETKLCKRNVLDETFNNKKVIDEFYKCENGACTLKTDGTNEVENGIYLVTVGTEEKMFKCAKKKCWPVEYNGMYVVETLNEVEKVVLDDVKLDALEGILDKDKKFSINECLKGVCKPTEGYVRYGVGHYIAGITRNGGRTVTDYVRCKGSTAGDSAKLLSNMDLCINGSAAVGVSRAITGVGALTGTLLYQRSSANVVGAALDGYYVYNDDNKNKIVKCEDSTCQIIGTTFVGYVLNGDYNTNSEKPLIYCTANDNCNIQAKEANGYYLYEDNNGAGATYTECDNDVCVSYEQSVIAANNCGSHGYKIIYDSGYKFCSSALATAETINAPGYRFISGDFLPGKLFNYPTSMEGSVNRKIMIKMTANSVTALTGDAIPIGYLKVGNKYHECLYDDEGNTMCKEADVSGTTCDVAGKLYTAESKVNLCVKPDTDPLKVISVVEDYFNTPAEYLIPLGDGLFGIQKRIDNNYYISLKIGGNNIIVNKEPKIEMFKYTDSDATTRTTLYKIFSRAEADGARSTDGICKYQEEKPFEFNLVQWSVGSDTNLNVDYYIEGNNRSDLNA